MAAGLWQREDEGDPSRLIMTKVCPRKVCSALDPDKGTELELTVYTRTAHDRGVNQVLCAGSKLYIDDLRVKCEEGPGEVHVCAFVAVP